MIVHDKDSLPLFPQGCDRNVANKRKEKTNLIKLEPASLDF